MDQSFVDALNELMAGRGISNNELARQIDVDPAQIGRWRKGHGRPRPENLVRAAVVFGVDHAWLWALAYPEGVPESAGPHNPRLAAFIAQIEAAFHSMSPHEWEVREEAGRALFAVPPTTPPKGPTTRRRAGPATSLEDARRKRNAQPTPAGEHDVHGPVSTVSHRLRGAWAHTLGIFIGLLSPTNPGLRVEPAG